MSIIKNAANPVDEVAEANRNQIEFRGTWLGLIYDEMKNAGLDAEAILRRATKRCGNIRGENLKKKCADPNDCEEFMKIFPSALGLRTFNINPINADKDNMRATFNYCPLVTAWQKLGFDDDTCNLLCDIAMDGDRGIAEAMGYKLNIESTIAQGCPGCKLHFHK